MSFFSSLGPDATVLQIYRSKRDVFRHWVKMSQPIMQGPSELSTGERELIASYVSALNGCEYCRISHQSTMAAWGVDVGLLDELLDDIQTAGVDARLRPVLDYARKLTLTPGGMTAEDARAVLDAGWSEQALQDTILVICHFNYMNRLVEGHGLRPMPQSLAAELAEQRVTHGYHSDQQAAPGAGSDTE